MAGSVGVLLAWVVIGAVGVPLVQWFVRKRESQAHAKPTGSCSDAEGGMGTGRPWVIVEKCTAEDDAASVPATPTALEPHPEEASEARKEPPL